MCFLERLLFHNGRNLPLNKLLTYPEVKAIFGWKSTTSVRRYVRSGDLERVHLGNGMNTYRITEESALAFVDRLKHRADERTYAERAAKHTEHMRRTGALPEPEPDEVVLDAEEIVRQSRLRTPEPEPQQTLDDALANRNAAMGELPRRPAGLGFRTVRGV